MKILIYELQTFDYTTFHLSYFILLNSIYSFLIYELQA